MNIIQKFFRMVDDVVNHRTSKRADRAYKKALRKSREFDREYKKIKKEIEAMKREQSL